MLEIQPSLFPERTVEQFTQDIERLKQEIQGNCSGGVIKNALHQNGGNQHKN
jgi:hypothetical protein